MFAIAFVSECGHLNYREFDHSVQPKMQQFLAELLQAATMPDVRFTSVPDGKGWQDIARSSAFTLRFHQSYPSICF